MTQQVKYIKKTIEEKRKGIALITDFKIVNMEQKIFERATQ